MVMLADTIFSGTGNDYIDGGDDIDTVNYSEAFSAVNVDLGLWNCSKYRWWYGDKIH